MAPRSPVGRDDVPEGAPQRAARGFVSAPISAGLLAANSGVFVGQVILSGQLRSALEMPERVLRWLGANSSLSTIADNRIETLVTSCLLHHSVLHLVLNMLLLWQVGPLLERAVGSARFFSLYLMAGVVASASSAIWGRLFVPTCSVGASGALCGLIAAALVVGVRTEGWKSELAIAMVRWLGLILLVGLLRAIRPEVAQLDNAAHIGGAAAGALVALTWRQGAVPSARSETTILFACVAAIIGSGVVVVVRDRTDPYLFMRVEERARAAEHALYQGNCSAARALIARSLRMDSSHREARSVAEQIERRCTPSGR